MGQDLSYMIESYSRSTGEYTALGSPFEGWRDYEVFETLREHMTPGLPPDASLESKYRFTRTYKDSLTGEDRPVYNCGVGSISYRDFIGITHLPDIYKKKYTKDARVILAYDW